MKLAARVPPSLQPPPTREDPAEFLVRAVERVTAPLPGGLHRAAARGLPWAYGISWPLVFGLFARRFEIDSPRRAALGGALLGVLAWSVGYLGWLPATGLTQPVQRQPIARTFSSLATHVAWGSLAALPIALSARARA
jgi:hypothetical protein